MKNDNSPLYMICNEQEETVHHFMSGCLELAKNEYLGGTIRRLHISIGRPVGIRKLKYRRGDMNTSLRRSPRMEKSYNPLGYADKYRKSVVREQA